MTEKPGRPQGLSERDRRFRRTVGARIRGMREERGWAQVELAGRTGIQTNRLSRIETGQNAPRLLDLMALREALGVSVDAILAGSGGGPLPQDPRLSEALRGLEGLAGSADLEALLRLLRILQAGLRALRRSPATGGG